MKKKIGILEINVTIIKKKINTNLIGVERCYLTS